MIAECIDLASCMRSFVHVAVPAWVLDPNAMMIIWGNQPAIELWRAADLDELLRRDLRSGAPESVMVRTQLLAEQVRAGNIVREEWVFHPKGQPTTVTLDMRPVLLPDGAVAVLCQALPAQGLTPELQRAMVSTRHASTINAMVRHDGQLSSQNAAAQQAFGALASWLEWLAEPALGRELLTAALAGQRLQSRLEVRARGQSRWHFVDAQMLHDPVTGEAVVLVEHTDETARIEAEQRAGVLGETLALVEHQRQQILALSAPILDVGRCTLAVPIIGRLGAEQSEGLMDKLLDAVAQRGAQRVILDVTGILDIDRRSAERLRELVAALRLLGARATITGVRSELALALIESGVDLGGVETLRSLAEGLR